MAYLSQRPSLTTPPITVLVTGFKPFADCLNISEEVLKALPEGLKHIQLVTRILDVDREKSPAQATALIQSIKPDFVIHLGEQNESTQPGIYIEQLAALQKLNQSHEIQSANTTLADAIWQSGLRHFKQDCVTIRESRDESICFTTFFASLLAQEAQGKEGKVMLLHLLDTPPHLVMGYKKLTAAQKYLISQGSLEERAPHVRALKAEMIAHYANVVADLLMYIDAHPEAISATHYSHQVTPDKSTNTQPYLWNFMRAEHYPVPPLQWETADKVYPPLLPHKHDPKHR